MSARSWAPLGDTCNFPIDLEQKPGVIAVTRQGQGRSETARITIEPRNYGTQEIELPDIAQANPSPADLQRNARERVLLAKAFNRKEGPARFTLPLGKPANPLPEGKAFGVDRIFNGKPAAQPHTGTDYPVRASAPVLAVAEGTVILAQDLFYPGNGCSSITAMGSSACTSTCPISTCSPGRRSGKAIVWGGWVRQGARRARIYFSACVGTTPGSIRGSC